MINHGDASVVLQVRLFTWTQDAKGDDLLETANGILFTPSIMRIEPNSRQTVRFALRPGEVGDARIERSFRIFLDELPQENTASENVSPTGALIRMRYVLPLFVGGEKGQAGPVDIEVKTGREGCVYRLQNKGARHVRVFDFQASLQGRSFELDAPRYLLPAADVRLPCLDRKGGEQASETLKLETNVGAFFYGDGAKGDISR